MKLDMRRNQAFYSQAHEPFKGHSSLELQHERVTGPFSFLNPTLASFRHTPSAVVASRPSDDDQGGLEDLHKAGEKYPERDNGQSASDIEVRWRSRDNRKGRHALVFDGSSDPSATYLIPQATSGARAILRGVGRMITQYPYWDVSWLVATIFTLGSVVWVINAFFAFLPLVQPNTEFHNELLVGGGVSAFIGATIFEIGSVLLMIEVCQPKIYDYQWAARI